MLPEPLSCHVPCFPRCCPYKGTRGAKRYRNQHAKAQRLSNKIGFTEYWRVLQLQRLTQPKN